MSDYTVQLTRNSVIGRTPVVVEPPLDLQSAGVGQVLRWVVGEEREEAALALIGPHLDAGFQAPRRDLIGALDRAQGQVEIDGVAALAVISAGWRADRLSSIEAVEDLCYVIRLIQAAERAGDELWVSALEVVRQRVHCSAMVDAPQLPMDGMLNLTLDQHPRDLAAGLTRLIAAIETIGADLVDARLDELPRVVVLAGGSDSMTAVQMEVSSVLPVIGIAESASPGRLPMLVSLGAGVVGEVYVISVAHYEAERQLAMIAQRRAAEVQAAFREHRRPSFARFDQASRAVEQAAAQLYAAGVVDEAYVAQQLTVAADGVSMRGVAEMAA